MKKVAVGGIQSSSQTPRMSGPVSLRVFNALKIMCVGPLGMGSLLGWVLILGFQELWITFQDLI